MQWAEIGFPVTDVSNLTATAILGWYAWHTVSRTFPAVIRAFRDEMNLVRAECRVERDALHQLIAAERFQLHADHMAIVEALNELSERTATARSK